MQGDTERCKLSYISGFGEDYKKLSPRAIIDICTNLDSIDVNKNIMRQIATRVSVFMFNLIDNSTIKIDDDYEYEYGRIKEDKELFDIIKIIPEYLKILRRMTMHLIILSHYQESRLL